MKILFFLLLQAMYLSVPAQNNRQWPVVPRLSPKPFLVAGLQQAQLLLDGQWNFQAGNGAAQHTIQVPGEWEMQGFTVNEGEAAVYTRELIIPAAWEGKKIKLRFDGVSSHAVIKVNGKQLAVHEGGFVPFETDITTALTTGKNVLEVAVQALTISDRLACTSQYAVHTVGGILRHVVLLALPQENIADLILNTTFDNQFKNATLTVDATLANESASPAGMSLRYILKDATGKIIAQQKSAKKTIAPGAMVNTRDRLRVKQPEHWNPEHPYLYTLYTELYNNGKLLQTLRHKTGFRQIAVKGNQLLVNGMPVKLHGVNRHSIYPLTGRSTSDELEWKDAALFREGNCNYIRTSHYPPTETFLAACDSLGLFVESESALCWIQHGASPIWKKWDYLDSRYLPYMVQANVEKMIAQQNHPSVIIWSLANESRWSPLWATVNNIVKQLDPSRPTTFHDQCWGGFNNAGSTADIAVYHYPGINGAAACDTMKRPVLFGEYAHVSCYNRRELVTDPGVREAYGEPLVQMYDSMYHHKACLGGAIWSGIDDIFHMPDGRIIGYGPWGPVDAWRRTKPEFYGMKKAYAPVVVTHTSYPGAKQSKLTLTVENRYDFTSLKNTGITYKINGITKTITAAIAPHDSGLIHIPVDAGTKEIGIAFTDPRGFIVNEEKIILVKDSVVANSPVKVSLTENDAAFIVKQGAIEYHISKTTGIILSAKKSGKQILSQGPVFGVIPMNSDDGGKPNVAGETYQNNIHPVKNYSLYTLFAGNITAQETAGIVTITTDLVFNDGSTAKQSYDFQQDGNVEVAYEVQYHGNDTLPRQYGLMMQLPKSFDRLSWKRKGSFSTYPENDIGRTAGSAMMQPKQLASVEAWGTAPGNDWKDDANELGSNDFRSAKRNIYHASLHDKSNTGIHIISDGTQAVRSWLQDEQVQLLVADYSNSGSEPFYGSPHSYGRISIKNKLLKGKLVFRVE